MRLTQQVNAAIFSLFVLGVMLVACLKRHQGATHFGKVRRTSTFDAKPVRVILYGGCPPMSMIPPEKLEAYKRGALERERRRRQEEARRRERAWQVARRAAALLKEQFGATRVVVFGSLAHGAWFRLDSDIDLAAAGIPPEDFWRAWCALDTVSEGFEINLVALESAPDALRQSIEAQGVEL